ncbi:hypothetical protein EDB94_0256 [Marinobacter sp. 3-2]|jgi:hypothetical protein|uniref:hypothetical protein n=1 Tax=Marinobacter sp. 3-2 TaxID=2485141 RepID=UPI000D3C1B22|nr:hypothetical protein [Marinobacter sp. 3-2]ROQ48622.1 hypothetical protein EDB94_0256 [Marinobacter sp. 3-2]
MKIALKVLGAAVALFFALTVNADETFDGREIAQAMKEGFANGYVDAEIRSSCLIQTTAENREYVANEEGCRESLIKLQGVLSEGGGLADQIDQVKRFRAQYGI